MKYLSLLGAYWHVLYTVQCRYGAPQGPASVPQYASVLFPGLWYLGEIPIPRLA